MATKLAFKHKDSLALKENGPPHRNNSAIRKQCKLQRCGHVSFPWTTLSVFLVYWFILCPLIWAICYSFAHWPSYWPFFFWVIAFLIWAMIMCGLMIFWRHFQAEQSREINAIPKYGSDNVRRPLSIQQISFEDVKSLETKKRNNFLDTESMKSDRENFLKKDPPPLVIHKQISVENIEDTAGMVRVEEDEETRLSIASNYAEKSPLQDYLKLVTVLPSEDEVKSPKTPMSPRELFFIDLIREAEKAESAEMLKTKTHFFPSEAIGNDNAENVKNLKDRNDMEGYRKNVRDVENAKDEKDWKASESRLESESSYFIADVKSPIGEKTEVFLQIDSDMGDEKAESIMGKPMLILQSNEANSQETFTSPS